MTKLDVSLSNSAIEVFFSYSHRDEDLMKDLVNHLSTLKRQGVIRYWHNRQIDGGQEWAGEIDKHLNSAQVILLLISPDFLASDYCCDIEMKRAMERHESREADVIPVILRPVDLEGSPFSKLQNLPRNGKPVTTWADRDEAFLDIAQGIRRVVEELNDAKERPEKSLNPKLRAYGVNYDLLDINTLIKESQLLQVSPHQLERIIKNLECISSVRKRKKEIDQKNLKPQECEFSPEIDKYNYEKEVFSLEVKIKLFAEEKKLSGKQSGEFFKGEPVETKLFLKVCKELGLIAEEIVDVDFLKVLNSVIPPIRLKRYSKIQSQCGTLKILDVAQPIDLDDLYVDVNVLNTPNSYRHLTIDSLPQIYDPEANHFDRLALGQVVEKRIGGLEAAKRFSKLMILGKPGSGKSTFLQYLAIQCNQGLFKTDQVPIFIRLKLFSEDANQTNDFSLVGHICREFKGYSSQEELESILKYGLALILLDGLDEIIEKQEDELLRQIQSFCEKYPRNSYVLTCRISAQKYIFSGFTYVEISDFNQEQIIQFSKKFFHSLDQTKDDVNGRSKACQMVEVLNHPENQQIKEIAITPILLILICLVFHVNSKLPSRRSDLYREGLEILLSKWDSSKAIRRDEIYRDFTVERKLELLAVLAFINFKDDKYFFKRTEVEKLILNHYALKVHRFLRG